MKFTLRAVALAAALIAFGGAAEARGGHSSGHHSTHHSSGSRHKASGVQRDSHDRIKRSSKAKGEFKQSHPCPSTGKSSGACPGYTIDHVTPLYRGGADAPSNMQWQTKEAAKDKDKWE